MASFMQEFQYANITGTSTTNVVFTGKGLLHSIIINGTSAGVTKLFDSTSTTNGNATKIGTIAASPAVGSNFTYDVYVANGLVVTLGGSPDITVCYTQG